MRFKTSSGRRAGKKASLCGHSPDNGRTAKRVLDLGAPHLFTSGKAAGSVLREEV